jgi:hypothetical protein
MGGASLSQRMLKAGDPATGSISKTQFIEFMDVEMGMMPTEIISLQRIAGFISSSPG